MDLNWRHLRWKLSGCFQKRRNSSAIFSFPAKSCLNHLVNKDSVYQILSICWWRLQWRDLHQKRHLSYLPTAMRIQAPSNWWWELWLWLWWWFATSKLGIRTATKRACAGGASTKQPTRRGTSGFLHYFHWTYLMTTGIKTWLFCMTKPCKTHRTHARWFVTIGLIRTSATVKRRNGKAILSKSELTTTSERTWAGTASQSIAKPSCQDAFAIRFLPFFPQKP